MQALIDATVKLRYLHSKRTPASIETIRDHLDSVYYAVQHENDQRDKSYSGIRAHVISNTISLIYDVYQSYLLNIEILNSEFFILVRDVIVRAFNETRHELVSDDEKRLLQPVCDIILKIANSMTPELADCDMISLFFDKTVVLLMTEGLKAFAAKKVSYGVEQKVMIIKAILNMFSEYCVAKGDEIVSNTHVISLVNATLGCISSSVYLGIFNRQLQQMNENESLTPKRELFLEVCPKYIVNYKKARHEPMFTEAKHIIVNTASNILPQFILQKDQIPSYLFKSILHLIELLLLIPSESFISKPSLIKDLINIVKLSENNSIINKEIKTIIQRSISLIYTLTTSTDLCKIIIEYLSADNMIDFFDKLSSNSSNKHIRFTSALISWTLNRQNMTNGKYSPEMIKTFVRYLNKCKGDPLQQCRGVHLDSMITTLTDLVENEDTQKELIKQDAVPVIIECATDKQCDSSTVQQPSLECLLNMVFTPEVFTKLIESPKFLAHLRTLLDAVTTTKETSVNDNIDKSSEELARIADSLLWKLLKEPTLLAKENLTKKFEYDIMISYQRKDQNICEKLYHRLKNENKFHVWFDEEDLYGPIMTRMAEGIEKSEFVLILMSELYQKSPYCRSEAIYASKIKRCIIPLKLYSQFKPTGWLGMTISDILYIDFTEKRSFDIAYKELIEQIVRYRRSTNLEPPKPSGEEEPERLTIFKKFQQYVNDRIHSGKRNTTNGLHSCTSTTSSRSSFETSFDDTSELHWSMTTEMKNWTCHDVEDFLHEHRLKKFSAILSEADGEDLFRLYLMSQESDNKLLEYMSKENPEIKIVDYLRFAKIIKKYAERINVDG